MFPNHEYWVEVDDQGRLVLPSEVAEHFGMRPGSRMLIQEGSKSLQIHRPVTQLAKVYVEPTSRCNLSCRTCIRNAWEEPQGDMSAETFEQMVKSLKGLRTKPEVFFGGFGEPLLLPQIAEWVARLKPLASKVELITNGLLLSEELAHQLIDAGLDTLWVSVDGVTPESYADVRIGAALPTVFKNITRLAYMRHQTRLEPEIGISFVAMRRNIADLPELIHKCSQLGVSRFMVTNIFPYTQEMCREMLYRRSIDGVDSVPSPWSPLIDLPRMDLNADTQEAFVKSIRYRNNVRLNGVTLGQERGRCPFIERGSLSVGWDGSVSPCLALLHHYLTYLNDQTRSVRRYIVGNLGEQDLKTIWDASDYVAFRKRVQEFDFSPCTWCGGCEKAEQNEEDCFGNTFPACGGCLWAQGVIQCP